MHQEPVVISELAHGSDGYWQMVALRYEVLRKPLGLEFDASELALENDSFHLTCWVGDQMVACVVMKPEDGGVVRLRQCAVAGDWRGRGIGRLLVEHAQASAAERGFREIVMHARESAVGFYEKQGYRIEGARFIEVTIPHFSMSKSIAVGG